MKHYHCTVVACDEILEKKHFIRGTSVQLIGYLDEDDAINRAKKLINRKEYQVTSIWECRTCGYAEENIKALQSVGKFFKKESEEL